ncbi:uncharacterized protein LOC132197352 isoform X2 [Neocloeon triangulifer]|uniref:uncharacterized protein LOC132197352 isoform X2 n=1 Tax=Neocloeon triangulifer TaxID=2078957 RepID=UPI00286F0C9C|nr:uncharacterized protein LOC132197352 isoform X2 [Neocloeon triangulifer]
METGFLVFWIALEILLANFSLSSDSGARYCNGKNSFNQDIKFEEELRDLYEPGENLNCSCKSKPGEKALLTCNDDGKWYPSEPLKKGNQIGFFDCLSCERVNCITDFIIFSHCTVISNISNNVKTECKCKNDREKVRMECLLLVKENETILKQIDTDKCDARNQTFLKPLTTTTIKAPIAITELVRMER